MSAAVVGEGCVAKSKRKEPKRAYLNTWDVTEMMPGARPEGGVRPNPAQKEAFESRAKKLWEWEKYDEACVKEERQRDIEMRLEKLIEMFPSVERTLVGCIFAENDQNVERCVTHLLAISEDVDPAVAELFEKSKNKEELVEQDRKFAQELATRAAVDTSDAQNWPGLSTADGWESCTDSTLRALERVEMEAVPEEGHSWKDRAEAAKALPPPTCEVSHMSKTQLTGYASASVPKGLRERSENHEEEREFGNPHELDCEVYKKVTRKREHKYASYAGRNTEGTEEDLDEGTAAILALNAAL